MFIELKRLTWILMLLFLSDVLCDSWKVEYRHQHICAVKGSSVVILCSFYPPNNLTAKYISWTYMSSQGTFTGIKLREASSRFQYIGDRLSNCSMRIRQVEKNDTRRYSVAFVMGKKHRIIPYKSLLLKVVDLKIIVTKLKGSRDTLEGDSVNLTCMNSCDDRNSSDFSWFKNGGLLNEGPVLYLSSVSFSDSGSYTCSLKAQPGTTSGAVNIDVEYGPRNTSVSVIPLMGNYTGMNFTLTCSSDANPPVENYTWFKKDKHDATAVGHHSVLFTDEAGQYFCRAANKHGSQSSSVVTVGVKSNWTIYTIAVIIVATVAVLLIVVTAIAIRRFCIKSTWQPTSSYIEETEVEDTDYVNWLPCDTIQSQEDNQHGEGTELVYATIDFSNCNNNRCLSRK